jgi:preprotein translocase subunit SecA
MFQEMMRGVREEIVKMIFRVQISTEDRPPVALAPRRQVSYGPPEKAPTAPIVKTAVKIGRNDPCPCGSGKKYKKCCLLKEGGT